MTSIAHQILKISNKHNKEINQYCQPLFDYLNINQMFYFKVTNEGYYSTIGTHLPWCEYYYDQNLHLTNYHLHHPKNHHSGLSFMSNNSEPLWQKHSEMAKYKFNINFSLLLQEKTEEGLEVFGFGSALPSEIVDTLLLNEIPLIRLFTQKFKEENHSLVRKAEDNPAHIINDFGIPFYDKAPFSIPKATAKEAFLKNMGFLLNKPLTAKEKEILKLMVRGFNAREIAEELFLSKRTVEHYIENIKNKLNCEKKSQLVEMTSYLGIL